MTRHFSRESPVPDYIVAVLFVVVGTLQLALDDLVRGPLALNLALVGVLGVAAVFRRRRPLTSGYVLLAALVVFSLWLTPPPDLVIAIFGLVLWAYAVGSHGEGRGAYAYPAAVVATVLIADFSSGNTSLGDIVFPSVVGVAAWMTGRSMRARVRLAIELHEAALRAREEHEAHAARAVAAERDRIAREMHDVVAHSISVMIVQAGGARRILERDPARAAQAAAEIERTGGEALLEMRGLLGLLSTTDARLPLHLSPDTDAPSVAQGAQ